MAKEFFCTEGCASIAECKHPSLGGNHKCVFAYQAKDYDQKYRWTGDGDPPRRWKALDGTIVYRSYADYCD